jgi:hypothetical protein
MNPSSSPAPTNLPGDTALLAQIALHDPNIRQAQAAVVRLREEAVHLSSALQAFMAALHHDDPLVRRRAAQALSWLGAAAAPAAGALCDRLRDPSWPVREAVVQAIAVLPGHCAAAHAESLTVALHDRSPLVREAAGRAAVQLGLAEPAVLRPALCHPHARVRRRAVELLSRLSPGTSGVVPALADAIRDGHVKVRQASIAALGRCGAPALLVLPRLVRCAFATEPRERTTAVASVRALLSEPAASPLRWLGDALTSGDPEQALAAGLDRPDLPAAVSEGFRQACSRRREWYRKRGDDPASTSAWEPPATTLGAAQELTAQLAPPARRGEFAWLLGLLCELWLMAP